MSNRITRNFLNIFLILVAICGNICLPATAFSQSDIGIEFKEKDQIVNTLSLRREIGVRFDLNKVVCRWQATPSAN